MKVILHSIILTGLFLILNAKAHSHESNDWKMRATIATEDFQKSFKQITLLDIDIAGVNVERKQIDVLISDEEYAILERGGFNPQILSVKGVSKGPDSEYQTSEEVERYLQQIAYDFPNITKLVSIGKSLEGRDIWALKISDNPQLDETSEPVLFFNSMHHAREVMSPEVGLDIIDSLTSGYGQDSLVTNWVEQNVIWVMPMFNVDGNNKMWSSDKWWRKNTRGGYGVDLNRNYPASWNKCSGSSGWRTSQSYRGPKPASEPETQAMMNFIKNIRPVFDISYHAYSELVIYPYGCKNERTQTKDVVEKIGKDLGRLLGYKAGTSWELLYNVDGGDIDWMYKEYQVIPFVIELNSNSEGFHPDYKMWRDKTVKRNRVGWQHLLERAHSSGIRGVVRSNGSAVKDFDVELYRDGKLYYEYRGQQNGVFHLVLNSGNYDLVIKSSSNKILTQRSVSVQSTLQRLDIEI